MAEQSRRSVVRQQFGRLLPATPRQRLALGAILLAALALRLLLWSLPSHLPANDEREYLQVARDLAAGRGWRFYDSYPWLRAPLYPLWLAGSLILSGGDPQRALLGQIGLSVAQVFGLWLLGRELARQPQAAPDQAERAGLWAAGFGAMLLTLATFANLWMAETLWNTLWTFGLVGLTYWRRRPSPAVALSCGILIGLAILTRSVPLLFLPVLMLWMVWQPASRRQGLIHAALLLAACLATIAPWTIRNIRAYSAVITVETGFAYNLWAFSEPPLGLDEIQRQLAAIPNPAARADFASQQGRALLAADPAILLRKIWPNSVYLWRIKPIEDRFLQQNYYSDPPAPYLLATLVFDDLAYGVLLLLAAWGLSAAPRDGRLALALLWIGYVAGTTALTHGEARYRHFIWPLLLAYAGAGLATRRHPLINALPRWQRRLIQGGGVALMTLVLWSYPWSWAGAGLARGWQQWQAERAAAAGDHPTALARLSRAAAIAPSPDGLIALGRAQAAAGQPAQALITLKQAVADKRDYPGAALALGEELLAQGDVERARDAWSNHYLDQQQLLDWGWHNATRPLTSQLEIGDGLDIGQLSSVYPAETLAGASARWTQPAARLRLPGGPAALLRLRLASPRPPAVPAAGLRLCQADACQTIPLGTEWRELLIPLPAQTAPREISLTSRPWTPASDERQLGVLLDWARLEALP